MPGVVDDLIAPEAAWVIRDDLLAEESHNAIGVDAHQNSAARRLGVDAVFVPIMRDQARRRRAHWLLDEPGERAEEGHEARPLFLEHFKDRSIPELRMLVRLA